MAQDSTYAPLELCEVSQHGRMNKTPLPSGVRVRSFDNREAGVVGEFDTIITFGPADFQVTFQGMDVHRRISTSYWVDRRLLHAPGLSSLWPPFHDITATCDCL